MSSNKALLLVLLLAVCAFAIGVPFALHGAAPPHAQTTREYAEVILDSASNTTSNTTNSTSVSWWQAAGNFLGSAGAYIENGAESIGSFFSNTVSNIGSFIGNLPNDVVYTFTVQVTGAILSFFSYIAKGVFSIFYGLTTDVVMVSNALGIFGPTIAFLILVFVLVILYTVVETVVKLV